MRYVKLYQYRFRVGFLYNLPPLGLKHHLNWWPLHTDKQTQVCRERVVAEFELGLRVHYVLPLVFLLAGHLAVVSLRQLPGYLL